MANGNTDNSFWIVIVIAAIGVGGYIYYQNNIKDNSTIKAFSWLSNINK